MKELHASSTAAGEQPIYFGKNRRLFGLYEPAVAQPNRECGVVVCAPVGQEYVRCHRVSRQLVLRLRRKGFATLRFDYSGCGDSVGEMQQAGLDDWLDDVSAAVDYLRARFSTVALIGLRLGATLGLLTSLRRRGIDRLVLWQPVVDGSRFLAELQEQHDAFEDRYGWSRGESMTYSGIEDATELLGFAFSHAMMRQIAELDLGSLTDLQTSRVLLLANADGQGVEQLRRRLGETTRLDYELIPEPQLWAADPYDMVVPQQSIQSVVEWMSDGAASA